MKKFNIQKDREKLSDQEIQQQMNFDKFISGYTPTKLWLGKGIKFYSFLATAITVVGITSYLALTHFTKPEITASEEFIDPPVKSLTTSFEAFNCLNAKDTTMMYNSGTIINVPASAFADENGNDISGSVQINYREFHDPIDIMLSGIPMTYDSAGQKYDFESAGMFEVTAVYNGKPVFLKPGKELTVNMVSHTNNPTDFNIYYLDTIKKQWQYISENTAANNSCIPLFVKNTEPNIAKVFTRDGNEIIKPVKPAKENSSVYNFVIDYKKNEFPELAAFNGLKFEPVEKNKRLHSELAEKTWDDVLVSRDDDGQHYNITFISDNTSKSIKAIPVVDDNNYEKAMAEFASMQNKYDALLREKQNKRDAQQDSLYRVNTIYAALAESSNLNERLESFIHGNFTGTSKDMLASRTLKINRLGVWNSDKPFNFLSQGSGERYFATFHSTDGEELILKKVTLINRNYNCSVNFSGLMLNRFPFNKSIDILMAFDYKNNIYFLKDEDLRSVQAKGETVEFKLKSAGSITKPEELKELLKL